MTLGTARPETLISDVVLLMTEVGLHHLPIVERDGRLAGIISQTDLVAALLARPEAVTGGAKATVPSGIVGGS